MAARAKARPVSPPTCRMKATPDGKLAQLRRRKAHQACKERRKAVFPRRRFLQAAPPLQCAEAILGPLRSRDLRLKDDGRASGASPKHAHPSHRELGGYRDIPKDEHLDAATTRTAPPRIPRLRQLHRRADRQTPRCARSARPRAQHHRRPAAAITATPSAKTIIGAKTQTSNSIPTSRSSSAHPACKHPAPPLAGLMELVDVYPTLAELATHARAARSRWSQPRPNASRSAVTRPRGSPQPVRPPLQSRTPPSSWAIPSAPRPIATPAGSPGPHVRLVAEELYDYTTGPSTRQDGAFGSSRKTSRPMPNKRRHVKR